MELAGSLVHTFFCGKSKFPSSKTVFYSIGRFSRIAEQAEFPDFFTHGSPAESGPH
jgi:hypothetical protein